MLPYASFRKFLCAPLHFLVVSRGNVSFDLRLPYAKELPLIESDIKEDKYPKDCTWRALPHFGNWRDAES